MVIVLFSHTIMEWVLTVGNFLWEQPILTPCWHCFFDLLFIVVAIIIIHDGLPQTTLPFCANGKLKCFCSAHRQIIWPCLPLKGGDEHTAFKGWPFQGMFCNTEDPFYLTSSLSPVLYSAFSLCFLIASLHLALYKNWAFRPWQDTYFGTLVCHLLGQPAFWIKLYTLPQYLVSWIHWPVGNTTRVCAPELKTSP